MITSRGSLGFSQSSSAGLNDIQCFQPKQSWVSGGGGAVTGLDCTLGSDGKEGCACWIDNSPTSATWLVWLERKRVHLFLPKLPVS